MRSAFTLIELLVVIAIVAVLVGILLPSLGAAREAGRSTGCLSNLHSMTVICRAYADDHKGLSPAIGQPFGALPNWAFVIQSASGYEGSSSDVFTQKSVLVCPTSRSIYGEDMNRTYAMNATGRAGQPGDPDNYDTLNTTVHIRWDNILRQDFIPIFVDSLRGEVPPPAPPPTRTLSPIDFRQQAHIDLRLGRIHAKRTRFNAAFFDGSARTMKDVAPEWSERLP